MQKAARQLFMENYAYNGDDLEADVRVWIAEGMSWRQMARLISSNSKHPVSHESLRTWYRTDAEQVAKATKAAKAKANTPLDFDTDDRLAPTA